MFDIRINISVVVPLPQHAQEEPDSSHGSVRPEGADYQVEFNRCSHRGGVRPWWKDIHRQRKERGNPLCWVRFSTLAIPINLYNPVHAGSTVKSPHILELSGIGDPQVLARLGIPVQVDLPSVGTNLQDRLIMPSLVYC